MVTRAPLTVPRRRGRARRSGDPGRLGPQGRRAQQLGEASGAGTRVIGVGQDQVQLDPSLAPLAQRQRLQGAARELLANHLVGIPREAEPELHRADRGRLVAHRPAPLGAEPSRLAVPAQPGVANHQLAMGAQVLMGDRATERVQRMPGRRDGDESQRDQRVADEAGRDDRTDRQIHLTLRQRVLGAAEHRLVQFDPHRGPLGREYAQGLEQQPRREHHVDREPQLGLPTGGERRRGRLERERLVGERSRAAVEQLPGRGQHRLAPLDLERLDPERRLELLDRIGDRGLTLVQARRRGGVAARLELLGAIRELLYVHRSGF